MYNIVLLCQWGASTEMVGRKIAEAAEKREIEVIVNAYAVNDISQVIDSADIILIGPQMRLRMKSLVNQYGDKGVPILPMNPVDYGRMNGENLLDFALDAIEKNK